jgi:hypothetical protein
MSGRGWRGRGAESRADDEKHGAGDAGASQSSAAADSVSPICLQPSPPVIGRALIIGVIGVVTGALVARGLSRYIGSLLLEVTATDTGVFAIAALVVFAVAVLAACVPAYQALRVDPVKSIRA